jgi:hypothetical protein
MVQLKPLSLMCRRRLQRKGEREEKIVLKMDVPIQIHLEFNRNLATARHASRPDGRGDVDLSES